MSPAWISSRSSFQEANSRKDEPRLDLIEIIFPGSQFAELIGAKITDANFDCRTQHCHGYMVEAVEVLDRWCDTPGLQNMHRQIVSLPGRTPESV